MQISDIQTLNTQVLSVSFLLSALFGAIAHRTHFCTMGAVSDAVNMGDWTRMRQWALAMGVAMIGFASLVYTGEVDPTKTLYASSRWLWLSALLGGCLFGFGMVLASGCGSKTLVRIGSGNLKSLVVAVMIAISAYATLKGVTAVARVASVDRVYLQLDSVASLPYILAGWTGWATKLSALSIGLVFGCALVAWAVFGPRFWQGDNLLAGVGTGLIIVAMWWTTGHLGFVAEHPETLESVFLATSSGRAEALSFVAPMAYALDWVILFSDKSKVMTVGVASVLGVVAGSAAIALATRSFRWEGFASTEDLANHLLGGLLMGVGGVTAMGCTIGQGLAGVSTLSATSFVALCSIIVGAVAAFKYQVWRLERMG